MVTYVLKFQAYKTTRYLLVERCLYTGQANRFLSLWENSNVRIFPGIYIWWWLSAWLHCSGHLLLFL